MGLDDYLTEPDNQHKIYSGHEKEEELENMVDEFQDRFPVKLEIEFIEVSPRMTKHHGMAYRRNGNTYFIRMSEDYVNFASDEEIRRTVLHEMAHVYFYQQGYSDESHGKYFRWVLGRIGASMTKSSIHDMKWEKCIEPFIQEDDL